MSRWEWTTTISAELESPAKFAWISARACTDSEPFACQPAPGERGLDLRREDAERDGDDRPGDRDDADVVGRPAAEPAERADPLLDRHRCLADFHYGHSTSPSLAVPTISYYYTNKSL